MRRSILPLLLSLALCLGMLPTATLAVEQDGLLYEKTGDLQSSSTVKVSFSQNEETITADFGGYTPEGNESGDSLAPNNGSAELTVTKDDSALDLTAKKDGVETAAFTYGDTITIEGDVEGTEDSANALNLEQNTAQLYCGETPLGKAADVVDGSFTLTYDTSEKGIPIGNQTLTVKYGGSGIFNESSETVEITLSKKPVTAQVALERITKQYNGEPDVEVDLNFAEEALVGEDEVTVTAPNAKFSDPYVGNDKEITLGDLEVGGKDAGWYEVSAPENVTGTIIMASTRLNVSVNQDGKFVYGDKIVVTFTPEAEYVPIPSNRSLSVDANNAVLYFEDEDDNEVVLARTTGGEDDVFTLTYDTVEKQLPCDDEPFMLYIKYGGSSNLQGSEGYAQITLERAPLRNTPTVTGDFLFGKTLTANYTKQDDETVTYQWYRGDQPIDGATSDTHTLTAEDVGQSITVAVTATDAYHTGSVTSAPVTVERPYTPPANPNYRIDVTTTAGGTVDKDPAAAKAGEEVTLTPIPEEGYEVGDVTVTDRFGDAVEVTEQSNGTYTFTMPSGQVSVEVTFVEVQPEPLPFTDVAETDWFHDAVRYVYDNGLMDGVGDGQFAPNATTNRAMVVTILYRLAGEPAVSGQSDFTDVADGLWYSNAVLWAAEKGIVNGISDTEFAPAGNLTREQLATILFRYAESAGYDVSAQADLSGFPDAGDIQSYATEALSWAVAEGLLQGFEDDSLQPQSTATRAQIATILMRFCQTVAK